MKFLSMKNAAHGVNLKKKFKPDLILAGVSFSLRVEIFLIFSEGHLAIIFIHPQFFEKTQNSFHSNVFIPNKIVIQDCFSTSNFLRIPEKKIVIQDSFHKSPMISPPLLK